MFVALYLPISGTISRAEESDADHTDRIERALTILRRGADNYPSHQECFACHHQTLPLLAMVNAAGLTAPIRDKPPENKTDTVRMKEIVDFTHRWFSTQHKNLHEVGDIGGKALTVGYGLWTLDLLDAPRDETTDAMVDYLLKSQEPDGSWMYHSFRPPAASSKWMTTAIAVYGLFAYGDRAKDQVRIDSAIGRVRQWHDDNRSPKTHEDLIGAIWLSYVLYENTDWTLPRELRSLERRLENTQRPDGGWAQEEGMESDAYATGQALVMLREQFYADKFPFTKSETVRKGLAYLKSTQKPDGSWHIKTHAVPVQEFFDNGDPYGKDQFISMMATGWATMALLTEYHATEKPLTGSNFRRLLQTRTERRSGPTKTENPSKDRSERFADPFSP